MLREAMTTDHESLETRVSRILGDTVVRARTLAGGKICEVVRIEFRHHPPVVAKHATPSGDLSLEANMLRHLRDVSDLPVPEVLHYADDLLVLEAVRGEHIGPEAARHCAELIAALHGITNASFGFGGLTLNGRVMLESPWSDSWIPFFREHRLRFAMRRAVEHEQLPEQYHDDLHRILDGLGDLLVEPSQPALLHGDLWNANVLAEGGRVTAFLDPSACYGDPELDIAYVDAFGAFGPEFLQMSMLLPIELVRVIKRNTGTTSRRPKSGRQAHRFQLAATEYRTPVRFRGPACLHSLKHPSCSRRPGTG